MSADFNAGSIEGTLDLDTSPFKRGLDWARAEAKKFERNDIKPNLGLHTEKFIAEKDKAKAALDDLDHTDAKPEVKLRGVAGVLAGLGLIKKDMKETDRSAITGMILKFGLLGGGVLALGAALGPATAAIVGFGAAGGVALGGLIPAFALFGFAAKSAVKVITDANKAGKDLTGWAGKAQRSLAGLTAGWKSLTQSVRPQMFRLLADAMGVVSGVLPKLAPLLRAVTVGLTGVVNQIGKLTHSVIFDKFLASLQKFMGGFLKGLGPVLTLSLATFMHLFIALQPLMSQLGHGILVAANAVDKFSRNLQHGGIDGFIGKIEKYLPLLGKLVTDVLKGLGHLGAGLGPLVGPALKFLDALVRAIGGLNLAPVAKGLGDLLGALQPLLPVVKDLVNKGLALLGPALSAVANVLKWLESHPGAVGIIVALGTAIGGYVLAMKAAELATKLFITVQEILDGVMAANPFAIAILAIAALAAGFIYAYKHSATFRKIVQDAMQKVKDITASVVGWFKKDFIPFFTKTIPNAFHTVLSWVKDHWPLLLSILTGPIGAAVIFIVRHWGQIEDAFHAALGWVEHTFAAGWNKVKDWIVNPVKDAWGHIEDLLGKIKNGFHDAVDAVGHFFSGLPDKLEGPIKDALNWLGDHFAKPLNSLLSKVGLDIRLPTFADGGMVPRYAGGGILTGEWKGPRADNLLIRANPREFIEPVDAVDYYGPGLFEALRKKRIPKDSIPRFGLGGLIGDAWGGVKHAASSIISAADPAHVFESMANKLLGGFSDNIWGKTVGSVAKKTVDALGDKVKDFVGHMLSGGGAKGAPGHYSGTSGVGQWAALASRVLSMLGQSQAWLPTLLHRMNVESGGNPRAINLWDSNAAAGHPSKGLMQTIDGTFDAYAGPYRGLGIWNPLANIFAGVNYALHRYGVPAVGGTAGYAAGTLAATPGLHLVGERGPEVLRFKGGEQVIPHGGMIDGGGSHISQAILDALLALLAKTPSGDDLSRVSEAKLREMIQIARAA